MADLTSKELFQESLKRCSAREDFIPEFYKRFLSKSEDIRQRFRSTDFEKQNRMLLQSLRMSAGATAGDPESLQELSVRAKTHDRDHLDIKPELYQYWLDSAVETAQEFDEHWNTQVASAWRKLLGFVIERMKRKY